MIHDTIQVRGDVTIEMYNREGYIIHSEEVRNLVTTAGKALLTRKLVNDTETITTIGIGSGTTDAELTDTVLETPLVEREVRFQSTENNIASFIATFEEDVPETAVTVGEVGLITDNDLLVCRAALDVPFEKATTDYLVINWKLQIG